MLRILLYGAGWPTNIGNAFISYGALHSLRIAAPKAQVYFASGMSRWFMRVNGYDMDQALDMGMLMDVDFLIVSGMNLCTAFVELQGPVLKAASRRGVRIVFNGCGGSAYVKEEVETFRRFLDDINLHAFISRDELSYESYRGSTGSAYNGIDCGFFLSDFFVPGRLMTGDYVVYNFDSMVEPSIADYGTNVVRTVHSCHQAFPAEAVRPPRILGLRPPPWAWAAICRGFRAPGTPMHLPAHVSTSNQLLVSDIPDDYLNLYANASAVYSDRVHACVAALSFGKAARLYSTSPRAALFDRLGVGGIRTALVTLSSQRLDLERRGHIAFLRSVLEES